jgi:acyl dehydratase
VGPLGVYSLARGMYVAEVSGKAIATLRRRISRSRPLVSPGDIVFAESKVLDVKSS